MGCAARGDRRQSLIGLTTAPSTTARSAELGDGLDLHQEAGLGQALDDDERARRVGRLGKDLVAGLADERPVRPVGDERGRLEELPWRCAIVREDRFDVPPGLAGLRLRIAWPDQLTALVEAELP